jgi:thiol-disulfide isomerase/thioredoxin
LNRTLIVLLATLTLLSPLAWAEDLPPAEPLFAATLSDVADKPVAMSAYKGKPLIVNFWARWCAPCREEIPELSKARAKYKARGLEVIGIAIEDNAEPVREFAKAYEIDYPVVLAKSKGLWMMQVMGNTRAGLPFTVAIDRKGNIVSRKLGVMKKADIEAAAEAALK